jgi:hypothetical protein
MPSRRRIALGLLAALAAILIAAPAYADASAARADMCDNLGTPVSLMPTMGTRVVDSLVYAQDMSAMAERVALLGKCLQDARELNAQMFELLKLHDHEMQLLMVSRRSSSSRAAHH